MAGGSDDPKYPRACPSAAVSFCEGPGHEVHDISDEMEAMWPCDSYLSLSHRLVGS